MMLKRFDIYGLKLNFTLNNKGSFKTIYGGIFSLFTVIIYLLLFNILAKDFYLKINPRITTDKTYITDSFFNNYTFNKDSLLLVFDNIDDQNLYNFTLNYIEYFNITNITNTKLDFISCDKTNNSRLFRNNTEEAKKFNCIDFTKIINKNITSFHYSDDVISKYIQIFINLQL